MSLQEAQWYIWLQIHMESGLFLYIDLSILALDFFSGHST